MNFEVALLELLKKFGYKTENISRTEILCIVGDLPRISIDYREVEVKHE